MILNFSVPGGANIGYNKACPQFCILDISAQADYQGLLNSGKGVLVRVLLALLVSSVYRLLYRAVPSYLAL
ncbi:hypothetical protein DU86_00390 [Methanosarcina mazei]|uniref:Uncharacterized protein n=1 Tax=Methanosarcina mazei TaxID=2209 RepID=A0A0F8JNC4_METMZ|nr:hypothetical protein DU40_14355 [Methanosarcina mazei]KKG07679.1 hypothetical protein DU31_10445 [Methanosarcina mazei]KKG33781.1 hypothetical protein DU49_09345 [Methanosarcina mazei]KKG53653.1 hypothetical protein DU38_11450 [Methanosarcina mazei]KKG53930.1 hypothetical protein DU33_05250 [Methanosarcina mazei]